MNTVAFKAYDVRGKYPEEVNEDLAYLVGRGLTRYLSAKTIVVGRDMRFSSSDLSQKIIEGIICEGADVIDIGMCTTPMLNFAVSNYNYDGGIMVTASHSPSEINGFKLIKSGSEQIGEDNGLKDIKELVTKGFGKCLSKGAVTAKDVLGDYLGKIMEKCEGLCHLKIVVDYGNGVGAISAKPALARLDLDVIDMYETPDDSFPNHPANPHDVENFNDLIAKVHLAKADLGIFFDGDADRAIFVDDLGRIVPVDLLTVLLAEEELRDKPNQKIYYDLRFSKTVSERIKKAKGIPVMMRVGNPFYKQVLKKDGGIMGAEFSGHIMYAENNNADDGLYAVLKTLKLICARDDKLSNLLDKVREYEASPEESMEAKNPNTVFDRVIAAFPNAVQVELDGVYLDFPSGFISVRRSQTEPELFRVRIEAKDQGELNVRLDKVRKIIQEAS
jgi:phosphomannomutase